MKMIDFGDRGEGWNVGDGRIDLDEIAAYRLMPPITPDATRDFGVQIRFKGMDYDGSNFIYCDTLEEQEALFAYLDEYFKTEKWEYESKEAKKERG